MIKPSSFC